MKDSFSKIKSSFFKEIKGNVYKKIENNNMPFYFIYKLKIIVIKESVSNLELNPLAIIVEKDDKYLLYPLDEDNIKYLNENEEEIVKDFLDSIYLGNGIFSDSTIISIK
ncbi:MAG: hypothetical protein KO202_04125 [Methanobacteriaceae archaeon]|jgi:hypothetical protein|nr:hypothetical protein [Methanobacteriaceae archaeon]